eukprot:6769822-Prymnesium_polylepis.1
MARWFASWPARSVTPLLPARPTHSRPQRGGSPAAMRSGAARGGARSATVRKRDGKIIWASAFVGAELLWLTRDLQSIFSVSLADGRCCRQRRYR